MAVAPLAPYTLLSESVPSLKPQGADERLAGLMHSIIEAKEIKKEETLKNRSWLTEAVLVGGDVFTLGYLGLETAKAISPSIMGISGVSTSLFICGEIAGLITIAVSLISLKRAVQALKKGDTALFLRLFLTFIGYFTIGAIMLLVGLSTKVAALGCVAAAFNALPWLLPLLFFAVSIPTIIELTARIKKIWMKQDLGAAVKPDLLPSLMKGDKEDSAYNLEPLQRLDDSQTRAQLSDKMELLEADMGVSAAIETFKLMEKILRKNETEADYASARRQIKKWNSAQYVRMTQRLLYTLAFGASMVGVCSSKVDPVTLSAVENGLDAAGNGIALYMDSAWPFKRNTPLLVPKV